MACPFRCACDSSICKFINDYALYFCLQQKTHKQILYSNNTCYSFSFSLFHFPSKSFEKEIRARDPISIFLKKISEKKLYLNATSVDLCKQLKVVFSY